jgi:hypothetical protein
MVLVAPGVCSRSDSHFLPPAFVASKSARSQSAGWSFLAHESVAAGYDIFLLPPIRCLGSSAALEFFGR